MRIIGYSSVSGGLLQYASTISLSRNLDADRLETRTGIVSRRTLAPGQDQMDLAQEASEDALKSCGLKIDDIDLLISTSSVPYQAIPTMSCMIAGRLGAKGGRLEVLDVNTSCLGFLSALQIGWQRLQERPELRVMIVSAETPSLAFDDAADLETSSLFSDGATAIILRSGGGGIENFRMSCHPEYSGSSELKSGGTRHSRHSGIDEIMGGLLFNIDGPAVIRGAMRSLPPVFRDIVSTQGRSLHDVDLVIPHQFSPFGVRSLAGRLGVPSEKLLNIAASRGNRVSASIPDALIHAIETGRCDKGDRVLLIGAASGMIAGGMLLRLG